MSAHRTLLCIDDEESGLRMRRWLLEADGFEVLTALDGPAGIKIFETRPADAVIVDYTMPGMDGGEVAKALKKLRPTLPIIMLSGDNSVPERAKQNIDAFITKGESPAVLLSTAASLLHLRSHAHSELNGKYVAFVDEHRRYLDVTDGVCELLGYSRFELLNMKIDDVTAPDIRSNTARLFHKYLADGRQQGEYVLLHRDRSHVPINYIARIFPDGCMVARWKPKKKISKHALAS